MNLSLKQATELGIPLWLVTAIEQSYSAETAYKPEKWSEKNPSEGHCTLVAILLHEKCGFDVVRGTYKTNSKHYWNRTEERVEFDVTADQFTQPVKFREVKTVSPKSILKHPPTYERYTLFRNAVEGYEP